MSTLFLTAKVAGAAAVAAAALVTGVHATASSPTPSASTSASPSTSASASAKVRCAAYRHPSAELEAARKAVRAQPAGTARRAAAQKVRHDVLHGTYGEQTQVGALRVNVRRLHLRAAEPDAMKAALKAARSRGTPTERRAARVEVLQQAAAGGYGTAVQKAAGRVEERVTTCAARRAQRHTDRAGATPSASPSSSPG